MAGQLRRTAWLVVDRGPRLVLVPGGGLPLSEPVRSPRPAARSLVLVRCVSAILPLCRRVPIGMASGSTPIVPQPDRTSSALPDFVGEDDQNPVSSLTPLGPPPSPDILRGPQGLAGIARHIRLFLRLPTSQRRSLDGTFGAFLAKVSVGRLADQQHHVVASLCSVRSTIQSSFPARSIEPRRNSSENPPLSALTNAAET